MVNWNKFVKRIPSKIKIGSSVYKIFWVDEFPLDPLQEGETDGELKQIIIRKGQNVKETVGTYLHECLHAFSFEYDINLTETQVTKLEKSLHYWFKPNNVFKKGSKSETNQRKRRNSKKIRKTR